MDRPRPSAADDRAPVAVRQPFVPDGRPVLLDRAGGQRDVEELPPAAHVAHVVPDPAVDLALHPDRGRLGEPGVLVGVVGHLQDVVVLVGEGHLEDPQLRGAGVLEAVVVVVEDEVAVQPAGQPAVLAGLAAVGGGVAEQLPPQVLQVDVGLAVAPTPAPVGARLAPAELAVLDRVDVGGDPQDPLDVVGHAVAVFDPVVVGERRRVEALRDPVHAEAALAGGRSRRLGDGVGVAGGVGMIGRARLGGAEDPSVPGACRGRQHRGRDQRQRGERGPSQSPPCPHRRQSTGRRGASRPARRRYCRL